MRTFLNEVRLLLGEQLLSWALSVLPSPEDAEFAAAINSLLKMWGDRMRQGAQVRETLRAMRQQTLLRKGAK
jgi:hypothetical protein